MKIYYSWFYLGDKSCFYMKFDSCVTRLKHHQKGGSILLRNIATFVHA